MIAGLDSVVYAWIVAVFGILTLFAAQRDWMFLTLAFLLVTLVGLAGFVFS